MKNQDQSFVLHSFIQRKNFQTTVRQHDVSNVRGYKFGDDIEFETVKNGESITIPMEHMKDFIMAAVESYCSFSREFSDKEIDITVTVKAK